MAATPISLLPNTPLPAQLPTARAAVANQNSESSSNSSFSSYMKAYSEQGTKTARNDGHARKAQKDDATGTIKRADDATPVDTVQQAGSEPAVTLPSVLHLSFVGAVAPQDTPPVTNNTANSDTNVSGRTAKTQAATPTQPPAIASAVEVRRDVLEASEEDQIDVAGAGVTTEENAGVSGELAFAARVTPDSTAGGSLPRNSTVAPQSVSTHASPESASSANSAQAGTQEERDGRDNSQQNQASPGNSQETARKPVQGASPADSPAGNASNAASKSDAKAGVEAAVVKDQSTPQFTPVTGPSQPSAERQTTTATTKNAASEASAPEPAVNDPNLAQANQGGVRSLAVNISDAQKNDVQVRFSETGGEVRVSVRSSDPQITSQMRDSLPDLAGRLSGNGSQVETWQPAEANAAGSAQGYGRGAGNQDAGDSSGGRQQNQGDGGQQGGNSQQKPQWLVELENSMKSGNVQTKKGS